MIEWATTDGPDVTVPLELHRNHDGNITFHRKHGGKWEDIAAIPADRLYSYFPQMRSLLLKDAYFSLHGFQNTGKKKTKFGFQRPFRKAHNVQYLTSCFVDIDCHEAGCSVGDAIGHIIDQQDAKTIPNASLLMRSGRGVWAFWFLKDPDKPELPQRAYGRSQELWHKLQTTLIDQFRYFGSDVKVKDLSRVTRVPGSINTKVDMQVKYWLQGNARGERYIYTLQELADFYRLDPPTPPEAVTKRVTKIESRSETNGKGNNGYLRRWEKAHDQFRNLWAMRGVFKEGTRNQAVLIYCRILKGLGLSRDEIWEAACGLQSEGLANGTHPYTRSELQATMNSAMSGHVNGTGSMSNQWISDQLDITNDEQQHLQTWPAASKYRPDDPIERGWSDLNRAEQAKVRRDKVQDLTDLYGVLTCEQYVEALETHGIESSGATITRDLKALGIENPRNRTKSKHPELRQTEMFEAN